LNKLNKDIPDYYKNYLFNICNAIKGYYNNILEFLNCLIPKNNLKNTDRTYVSTDHVIENNIAAEEIVCEKIIMDDIGNDEDIDNNDNNGGNNDKDDDYEKCKNDNNNDSDDDDDDDNVNYDFEDSNKNDDNDNNDNDNDNNDNYRNDNNNNDLSWENRVKFRENIALINKYMKELALAVGSDIAGKYKAICRYIYTHICKYLYGMRMYTYEHTYIFTGKYCSNL
jgi:hypothetical protein